MQGWTIAVPPGKLRQPPSLMLPPQDNPSDASPADGSPPDAPEPAVAQGSGGLRRTLFVGGGLIVLVIALVAGALILTSAGKILDQQADEQIKDNAARTSRLVEQSVLERRREIELLATIPWIVDLARTGKPAKGVDVNAALAGFRSRSLFRHLILYDRNGKVLASTDSTDTAPPRATPWWREAM